MELLVAQIIAGLTTGSVYALVALALVMVYRATRHLNFAVGEMATVGAFLALALLERGAPYWLAVLVTLIASFATGWMVQHFLIARLKGGSPLNAVVLNIGLLLIFNSAAGAVFGYNVKTFPSPFEGWSELAPGLFSGHQLGILVSVATVVALTYLLFEHTRIGLAMRATADNAVSSQLAGIPVGTMLALGWALCAAIGALAAVLIAPVVFLDPNMMAGVLVYGFAAALLGGIENPAGAVVGGLLVGVIENLVGVYVVGPELKLTVALFLIVTVLILKPAGLFGRQRTVRV